MNRAVLTEPYVENVLHGFPGLRVQDAAPHAQPHDGALTDEAADQDAQVAPAMVHQRHGAGLVRAVGEAEQDHGQDDQPEHERRRRGEW